MTKVIATAQAPEAIGPYIQGARVGGFIFTSGQLPINPVTGEIAGARAGRPGKAWRILRPLSKPAG